MSTNETNKNKSDKSKDQRYYFKLFVCAGITFISGMGIIVYVNTYLPESTEQEIYALTGLVLAGIGAPITIYSYLRLLLTRLKHFFNR